jgi:hypothetical protein
VDAEIDASVRNEKRATALVPVLRFDTEDFADALRDAFGSRMQRAVSESFSRGGANGHPHDEYWAEALAITATTSRMKPH